MGLETLKIIERVLGYSAVNYECPVFGLSLDHISIKSVAILSPSTRSCMILATEKL